MESYKIGIINYPTFGGSGILATELGLKLMERGHEVHFISYELPERLKLEEKFIFHDVNILNYPLFKFKPYSMVLASLLHRLVINEGLEILHAHYAIPHSVSTYLAKQSTKKAKIITTLHGSDMHMLGLDNAYKPMLELVLNEHDALTTVSNWMKKFIKKNYTIQPDIDVIYNFVDPNEFYCELRKTNDKITLCHASNFRKVKRSPDIIQAFAEAAKSHRNIRLELLGEGPELEVCRELAISLGVESMINFRGNVLNIPKILCTSDIFLLPSEIESFGLAALEAMSCGMPVITSDSGGLPELVEHGKTGFLIKTGDIKTLAKYIIMLIEDEKLRKKMGDEAGKVAREKFNPDLIVPQYEAIYKRVINKSK